MPPDHLPWLTSRSGCALTNILRGIEAIDENGRIHGAVGFDSWMGNAAQMHVAIENPRAIFALRRAAFDYIFNQCGKDIAIGMVPAHNEHALAFDKRLGFKEAYRLKNGAAPGDDMIFLLMRREDCRWLEH